MALEISLLGDLIPVSKSVAIRTGSAFNNILTLQPTDTAPSSSTSPLVPGASYLPTAIGSKLTIRNVVIGGALTLAAYAAYAFLAPRKTKA